MKTLFYVTLGVATILCAIIAGVAAAWVERDARDPSFCGAAVLWVVFFLAGSAENAAGRMGSIFVGAISLYSSLLLAVVGVVLLLVPLDTKVPAAIAFALAGILLTATGVLFLSSMACGKCGSFRTEAVREEASTSWGSPHSRLFYHYRQCRRCGHVMGD